MKRPTYYFTIADLAAARGRNRDLAFEGHSPEALARTLQAALRNADLFERWRARQEDPDAVDKSLAAIDAQATVHAEQADLKVDLTVTAQLPMRIVRQRLELLIGNHWELRDVR